MNAIMERRCLTVAVAFALSSTLSTVAHKRVLSLYSFQFPATFVGLQMIITVLILETLRCFNVISCGRYTWDTAKTFAPSSIAYVVFTYMGLNALDDSQIPAYCAVNSMTPILAFLMAKFLMNYKLSVSIPVFGAATFLVSGAINTTLFDVGFDHISFGMTIVSGMVQAVFYFLLERQSTIRKYSPVDLFYIHSLHSMVAFALIGLLWAKEMKEVVSFFVEFPPMPSFYTAFIQMIILGMITSALMFYSCSLNGALNTCMLICAKGLIEMPFGYYYGYHYSYDVFPTVFYIVAVLISWGSMAALPMTVMSFMKEIHPTENPSAGEKAPQNGIL